MQAQLTLKMKKALLIASIVGASLPGIAQDKYVVSANLALKSQNYDEAKTEIDKAMANPETKEKPKALYSKAQIYFALQNAEKYKSANPYKEGLEAAMKLAEVKPDYEKDNVDQLLINGGYLSYNEGVKTYNDKEYDKSVNAMKTVVKVYEMGAGGKRFSKMTSNVLKQFDTIAADAYLTMANAVYFSGNMDEAIPLLIKVKSNPIRNVPSVHQCLIDAYMKKDNSAMALAAIEEARKAFPTDVTIRNYELNYYIKSGKLAELTKKLEEASAKEPSNADLLFNLGTTYLSIANPKSGQKPANAAEYYTKSEDAFTRAIKLAPENGGFNYSLGALYFNQGADFNDQINAITGSSKADQEKYESLKAKRDGVFAKAVPAFEKAYAIFNANEKNINNEDLANFKNTCNALNRIYLLQNKMDKAAEMKKKSETL